MAFYALGSGVKGVMYFADWDPKPPSTGLTGVFHNRPLWDEMGRINWDIRALAPYLAVGCPAGPPVENDKVWYRSLMCGSDTMVVVVINKGHHIGYNTKNGFAWHWPAKNVQVSVPLADQMQDCSVREVMDGKLVGSKSEVKDGKLTLSLDTVDAARAFVISAKR